MQKEHWNNVYQTKSTDQVSWFQLRSESSIRLIEATGMGHDAAIIDVGSGASKLVDELWHEGFRELTVLDIAAAALETTRQRLGAEISAAIDWRVGNVLDCNLPHQRYLIWHDRAVFHFFTETAQQQAYIQQVRGALQVGGYVVIATFAEDGPERCSGLPVQRYSVEKLAATFGADFELVHAERETHQTPQGSEQKFIYCVLRRV
ncbi:class I SAM-dependent methyltransferase [Pseudidiomarina woesei]|uniref:Methyltransferase domain n=1 Tax=Pseudidiomarina woesei TaxID=1381080 RepID=A0A0K6GX94_9GAMM|nr:class I SAM-dependent methyltransferase [Pseudidiomarina woesei]CUA83113.1 Methyltransferase domain [Pseudidiomarina woesei]